MFEKLAKLQYLTQNHFDEYSSNPEKLNEHIIALVFDRFPDEKRKYEEMDQEIEELEQNIRTTNLDIEHLRSEVNGQKETEENYLKKKKGDRADCLQRLDDIERAEGKRDDTIQKLTGKLNELRQRKRVQESVLHRLPKFKTVIDSFAAQYAVSVGEFNSEFAALDNTELGMFPVTLHDLVTASDVIDANTKILEQIGTAADVTIQVVDKEIYDLVGVGKDIAELRKQEGQISTEIGDIENRIREILANEQRIADLDASRFDMYAKMVKQTLTQRLFLQSIIDRFGMGKDEMLGNISFSASINMNRSREYIQTLADKVDNRSTGENALRSDLQPIFDGMKSAMNGSEPDPDLTAVIGQIRTVAQGLKLKRSVTDSDYYGALLRKFFRIGMDVKFGDKVLGELSMGERAIVLLKILLALDDKPLLIDQPEEHLDNRYIYSELMPAFRNAKTKRQIIIATHNANLVVNTDAEQIIVAEHANGVLSYTAGTLEDLSIRDKITTILEGGDKAFEKREQKYGYRF